MMKFLAVFFCMSLMISNANAEAFPYEPSHPCFKTLDNFNDPNKEFDVTVYFDTGAPRDDTEVRKWVTGSLAQTPKNINKGERAGDKLSQCVNELSDYLASIPIYDKTRIFILATADSQGYKQNYDNDALSERRVKAVYELFSDEHKKRVLPERFAGDVQAAVINNGTDQSNQDERAVRILVSHGIQEPTIVEEIVEQNYPTLVAATGTVRTERKITVDQDAANVARRNVYNASQLLNGILNRQDVSVWKNKDGGFNTSRLISDSVAGVVLGTAGGLIVSNVVKKNQLNSGYENIRCTIGGQVVAGYGDEFVVGPR